MGSGARLRPQLRRLIAELARAGAARGACRAQRRWGKAATGGQSAVPHQRMQLIADRPDMIPSSKGPRDPRAGKAGIRRRNLDANARRRSISVLNPQTTPKKKKRHVTELQPHEARFAATARGELEDMGVGADERFRAWLDNDHSVFPSKVQELDPHVKKAVKFGGLGLTSQAENVKERYLLARQQENSVRKQLEREEEEAEATGKAPARTEARRKAVLKKRKLEGLYSVLRSKREELVGAASAARAQEGEELTHMNRDILRKAAFARATDQVARDQVKGMVQRERALQESVENERRKAEGRSPTETYYPNKHSADLSSYMAEVARAVLSQARTDGLWPLKIPAGCRPRFKQLANLERKRITEGMGKKDRYKFHQRERRQEAYATAKDAHKEYLAGDEFGGVKDARDWRSKHPWEWKKGSEPKKWAPGDPHAPWTENLERSVGVEAAARGMHTLMTTKQTSDKPPDRFYSEFSGYHHRMNREYDARRRHNQRSGHTHNYGSKKMRAMLMKTSGAAGAAAA